MDNPQPLSDAEIAEMRQWVARLPEYMPTVETYQGQQFRSALNSTLDTIAHLKARVERLEGALRPFAELFDARWLQFPDTKEVKFRWGGMVTVGQIRQAHTLIAAIEPRQSEGGEVGG